MELVMEGNYIIDLLYHVLVDRVDSLVMGSDIRFVLLRFQHTESLIFQFQWKRT